jgi:hypothetical protein
MAETGRCLQQPFSLVPFLCLPKEKDQKPAPPKRQRRRGKGPTNTAQRHLIAPGQARMPPTHLQSLCAALLVDASRTESPETARLVRTYNRKISTGRSKGLRCQCIFGLIAWNRRTAGRNARNRKAGCVDCWKFRGECSPFSAVFQIF